MKFNQWTLGLAAVGLVSLGTAAQAEEAQNPISTALSSTTISGYVNTSAILRFGPSLPNGDYSTPGRTFDSNSKFNGFNLDVVKLQIEKPLDESQWSAGYQVGLLFGPDANTYGTDSLGGDSDFGIKDAAVTLRAPVGNGLDFRIGYWESPIGYEVFDAGNNPNYSRSYAYAIEPKQFTGVLASYRVSEILSLSGGIANRGWEVGGTWDHPVRFYADNAINKRSGGKTILTYLGSVALTAPESAGFLEGATLYGGIIDSGMAYGPDVLNLYVGGTMPTPVNGLLLGLSYDYRGNSEDSGYDSSSANAFGAYLSWQLPEKLKFNARGEYVRGSNGTWYSSGAWDLDNTDDDGNPDPLLVMDGEKNELIGVTATLDYSLWANVLTRLEFRWDHDCNGNGIFNDYIPGVSKGTDDAFQLALNVIYKF